MYKWNGFDSRETVSMEIKWRTKLNQKNEKIQCIHGTNTISKKYELSRHNQRMFGFRRPRPLLRPFGLVSRGT